MSECNKCHRLTFFSLLQVAAAAVAFWLVVVVVCVVERFLFCNNWSNKWIKTINKSTLNLTHEEIKYSCVFSWKPWVKLIQCKIWVAKLEINQTLAKWMTIFKIYEYIHERTMAKWNILLIKCYFSQVCKDNLIQYYLAEILDICYEHRPITSGDAAKLIL